jgi:uncharacterized protein (DUF1697 family)
MLCSMTRYVAFLRAINVGGHTVRMEALKRHFEIWGGKNVETFIASGNVIFQTSRRDPDAVERAIEAHIAKALGYPSITFLRSISELAAIAAHAPFPQSEYERGGRLFVGFMKSPATRSMARAVTALRTDIDDLAVEGREVYWLRRAQLMASLATGPAIEKAVGSLMTVRNVNTVRRLAKKYCD